MAEKQQAFMLSWKGNVLAYNMFLFKHHIFLLLVNSRIKHWTVIIVSKVCLLLSLLLTCSMLPQPVTFGTKCDTLCSTLLKPYSAGQCVNSAG